MFQAVKKLTQEELNKILDQHKLWLDTYEEEGKRANFTGMDVGGLDFSGRSLRWAIFLEAYCYGANFTKAYCGGINFSKAYCYEANFTEARCWDANFSEVNCRYANFTKAYCYGANFSKADCCFANFSNADCEDTNFSGACRGGANLSDSTPKIHQQEKKHSSDDALDKVNHPKHYVQGGIEPIEYIDANNLDYYEGNVVKYITRYKHKNGIEDLEKAKFYLERLILKTRSKLDE